MERAHATAGEVLHGHPELRTEAVILTMLAEAYLIGAQHQWAELQKEFRAPEEEASNG